MNLVHSRIGIIDEQKSIARSWPQTVAAVSQFADCVAERCAPGRMIASQADLAMACEPVTEINVYYGEPQFRFVPSIAVDRRSTFAEIPREVPGVGQRAERFGEREARALFDRLFTRRTKVSSLEPFAAPNAQTRSMAEFPALQRADRSSSAIPVARILPKAAAIELKEASGEGGRTSRIEAVEKEWGTRLTLPVEAKPVVLAAPEVKRVAEQVMQEIQHRVIAQRERVGRR
jgi:hypothetical protein